MTDGRYLEVTYRHGRPFAAYLFLPREASDRSARQQRVGETLVIDYAENGRPIGIEIVHPQVVTEEEMNRALATLGPPPLGSEDLLPLRAA